MHYINIVIRLYPIKQYTSLHNFTWYQLFGPRAWPSHLGPRPPPLPPRGYFEWRAAMAAAPPPTQTASSTSLTLAPTIPTTISLADTISDVTSLIPITLDLAAHNYYHWCHLFDIHLGRYNLRAHIAADSVPRLDDPRCFFFYVSLI